MNLPLAILLIPYAFLILCFFVFAFFNLFHMIVYGYISASSFMATFLFLAGTAIIIYLSYSLGMGIDWSTPIHFATSVTY